MKRYDKEDLGKDLMIGFISGIGASSTVWFFALITPSLLQENYKGFFIGFGIYLLLAIFLLFVIRIFIFWKYGKNKLGLKRRIRAKH